MTTIETLTGDVNLRTGSAKCFVFHTPRQGGAGVEERHLGLAAKSNQTANVVRTVSPYPTVIPSVQGYSAEIGGKMVRMTYSVEEGEILKLFIQRRPGAGKLPTNACQFVRVREGAALRCVEAKMLTDPMVNEPMSFIRGRFDLLTLEEARALGVKVADGYTRMFHPANVEHVTTVSTVSPEIASASIVQQPSGKPAVVVTEIKRRRKIILG
jgi:hypothetical protein